MEKTKIGVLLGSWRKGAFSTQVANALIAMMPETLEPHVLDISELPMFNQDYDEEGRTPASWQAFRADVGQMDAYLIVTPEYNRSYPPVLKNALDVASRPYGENKWSGKPAAIASVSPGGMGAFGANHHLRQVLTFLNMYTMQQPEAYIGNCTKLFDADGNVAEGSRAFLQSFADAFAGWVKRFS